jgi:hypothetical protein
LGKFPQLFCLPRRHVGHTYFGTWGLANSIRPLSAHTTKRPILAPIRAQKLNSQINVQIGDGQEVFGWSTAGNTSQSHSGYPRWVTENIGNLVN